MKLFLYGEEKTAFIANGKVTVERKTYLGAPQKSIMHGTGSKSLFDKIAYRWVYGDTEDYIQKMKGEGRRGTEYIYGRTGDRNIINGGCWYNFNEEINPYSSIGTQIITGFKNKLSYKIDSLLIKELRPRDGGYFDIILTIEVSNF